MHMIAAARYRISRSVLDALSLNSGAEVLGAMATVFGIQDSGLGYSVADRLASPAFYSNPEAPLPNRRLCSLRREKVAAMLIDQFERTPAAARDAGERVVGDVHVQAGFLGDQLVQIAQQRTAASQHDAALGHIRAQLGRGLFERRTHRGHDAGQRLVQRIENLVGVDLEHARHAFGEIAPGDFDLAHLVLTRSAADFHLDALGGRFADQRAVVAAYVVDDRLVEAVAADAHRLRVDDAVERNHSDFRGAAADVEHHRAARLVHRNARADRRSHRFLDQIYVARAGGLGRFLDRAALDLGRAARHAHQHARARTEHARAMHLLDELLEHLLGHGEVGDDAVLHRPDRDDVARRATEHALGVGADRRDRTRAAGAAILADRHDRGLVQDDALPAHIDKGVGRTEVDRQ